MKQLRQQSWMASQMDSNMRHMGRVPISSRHAAGSRWSMPALRLQQPRFEPISTVAKAVELGNEAALEASVAPNGPLPTFKIL
jgi:hypothetical protein